MAASNLFNRPSYYAQRWGLQSYWNMQNVNDAYGGRTLTNNGGTTFTSGLIGNAATFASASSQSLSRASDSVLQTGNNVDFWLACWVNFSALTTLRVVSSRWTVGGASEWLLFWFNSTNRFRFSIAQDGTDAGGANQVIAEATQFGNVPTATWIFVFCWVDFIAKTVNIQINNGTPNSVSGGAGMKITPQNINLIMAAAGGTPFYLDGQMQAFAYGKGPPTGVASVASEISSTLYNAGVGRLWPF